MGRTAERLSTALLKLRITKALAEMRAACTALDLDAACTAERQMNEGLDILARRLRAVR